MPTFANDLRDTADLVLANPTAGGGLAGEVLPALRKFAAENGWNAEFRSAASAEEFAAAAREEALAGRRRILALGGDGTFQALLNGVAEIGSVCIGVLPAGGGNDLANALGLPGDALKAAALLLRDGEERMLDAARVTTSEGTQRLYMGGGGVGLDAEASRYASGVYRGMRGRGRYMRSLVRALLEFRAVEARVTLEGAEGERAIEIETLVYVVGVLNTPSYGAGVRLAPGARLNDGLLNVAIVEDLSGWEVLRALPALAAKGELRTKRVLRHEAERVRIETRRPCMFHADGEVIGQTPVQIEVLRGSTRAWCPRPPASAARGDSGGGRS